METEDALSTVLQRLQLRSELFVHADYCGHWAVDTSGHRKLPFHLIERGSGWLHVGNESPRLLTAGDFVVFTRDEPHRLASSEEPPPDAIVNKKSPADASGPITSLLCGFFEFQSKAAWPLLDGLSSVIILDLKESGRTNNTASLIQLMLAELERSEPGAGAVINELMYVLFVHLLRSEMTNGNSANVKSGLLAGFVHPQIGPALNLIHCRPGEDWSVARLAKEVGMSRSAFAEQFRALVGMSPMHYVTEWRMQEAVGLLQGTDRSLADIAETVGYSSEVAFRKAFRNTIGKPPGQIRRAAKS